MDFRAVANEFRERKVRAGYYNDPAEWARLRVGDFVWSKQREVLRSVVDHKRTLVAAGHGVGKALTLDTPMLTTRGWTTMDDLRVGDEVFSEAGAPTAVTGTREWPDRPIYRVRFDDGSYVDADAEHEWSVLDLVGRRRGVSDWRDHWGDTRVITTKDLHDGWRTPSGQNRYRIPTAAALSGVVCEPDIDPYLLGYWLGDGTSTNGDITTHASDIDALLGVAEAAGFAVGEVHETSEYGRQVTVRGLIGRLREIGVLGNKHVPEEVHRAPVEYRLAVVRGLLDAYGTVGRSGVTIDLCNRDLAEGLARLVRGLGTKVLVRTAPAKLYGRVTGTRYRLAFRPVGWEPFALPRKVEKFASKSVRQQSRATQRTIRSVEYLGTAATKCIEVDAPSHLYLAGEHLIPTHNSFVASRAIGWWLDTRGGDPTTTRVITTAPSWNQVANIMWAYVADVQTKAEMPGNITAKAAWTFPGYKAPTAYGRKPSDYDESTFQGIHAANVFVVIDEAGGVSENIFTSVEAITTNKHARILAIANPDNPSSYMAKIWREEEKKDPEDRLWNLITIGAFDSPNFTGEEVPVELQENLLQKEWVNQRRTEWGEDDPRYVSKVLARFPDVGEDGLFNMGRVLKSMTEYEGHEPDPNAKVTIGVDVGLSQTGDFSVIATVQDGHVEIREKDKGLDGNRLARRVGEIVAEVGAENVESIRVDAVGVGRGVQVVLENYIPEGIPVYWVIGNAASPDNIKWYNFRAAMYDTVSTAINTGDLYLPPDDSGGDRTKGLFDEFRSIKYEYRGSRLLIESKDAIKRRGGHSPDMLDAVCYAAMPASLLGADDDQLVDADRIMEETMGTFQPLDEWGNEEWSFAPA